MKLEAKQRLQAEDQLSIDTGIRGLRRLYPHGEVHRWRDGNGATFKYEYEREGMKIAVNLEIMMTGYSGDSVSAKTEPAISMAFKSFSANGGKPRGFHPEADDGIYITNIDQLPQRLHEWENYVANGMKRYL
jgi:hypothetical protein